MLWSLDQAIGAIIDQLEQQGKLDNTVIFYIADNGFFWGEHRLTGKNRVYEESIRVPFGLRYPKLVPQGRVEAKLAANIDIAPTIYELAGLPIPAEVNGRSFVPLLQGKGDWRDDLLIEGWPGRAAYAAAHTTRYVYVETEGDRSELYDLEKDPYQLENRVSDPAYAQVVKEMQERLKRLRSLSEIFSTVSQAQVQIQRDVVYGVVEGVELKLDIYRPELPGPLPAIIFVHGGGWVAGDKRSPEPYARYFAERGYVGFSVNYRFRAEKTACKVLADESALNLTKHPADDIMNIVGAKGFGHGYRLPHKARTEPSARGSGRNTGPNDLRS